MQILSILALFFSLGVHGSFAKNHDSCALLLTLSSLRPSVLAHRENISSLKVPKPKGTLQKFTGVGNRLVYNPTGEFKQNGKTLIAARVEALHDETQTEVMFFERGSSGIFRVVSGAPVFKLQDPFISDLGTEIVFGGVETFARLHP